MGFRATYVFKKSKPIFIAVFIVWMLASIFFLPAFTVGIVEATTEAGIFDFNEFASVLINNGVDIGGSLAKTFSGDYIGTFLRMQVFLIIGLGFAAIVGMLKSTPKHEYTEMEHGSSDWCEKGEQYTILSPKKGILLAEKHYLPVDKRGNVNVMIVGRIRFW
ncbi:MAG: hypothetical protein FWC79_01280 [Oscillospiraceae bacterium]|nr:hypothetical protein [Oscillospiraceae bacterium]